MRKYILYILAVFAVTSCASSIIMHKDLEEKVAVCGMGLKLSDKFLPKIKYEYSLIKEGDVEAEFKLQHVIAVALADEIKLFPPSDRKKVLEDYYRCIGLKQ